MMVKGLEYYRENLVTSSTNPPQQSFESALTELEAIVQKFEENKWTLEEAVEAYKRGMTLKETCTQKLESAKLVLETVAKNAEKTPPPLECQNALPLSEEAPL